VFAAGPFPSSFNMYRAENEDLRIRNQNLRRDIRQLQVSHDELDDLKLAYDDLEVNNQYLQTQVNQLDAANIGLQRQVNQLQVENQNVKREMTEVKSGLEKVMKHINVQDSK
jgi:chromosome segregation ATPase